MRGWVLVLAAALILATPASLSRSAEAGSAAAAPKADRVVVNKNQRQMLLLRGDRVLRQYRVALGRYPVGHKTRKGDARTPEGIYRIAGRLDTDRSLFHRALRISYPNARDRAHAASRGFDPGDGIMIHGLPQDWTAKQLNHPSLDWTQGCIGVTNREMDEIWFMVDNGTPVEIRP